MKGDRYCIICGEYLGNYLKDDYYALLHRKYCNDCGPWKRAGDVRFNQAEYRNRKRNIQNQKDQKLQDAIIEIVALRKLLAEKMNP